MTSWKEYESIIYEHLQTEFPDADINRDVRKMGALSKTSRQIDILISDYKAGNIITTAVDAKHHARPLDVKKVEEFIGLLKDISVTRGIMVSSAGYTKSAFQRAFADESDVDLDIFTLDEFKRWQAAGGIPYSGDRGVLLSAPLGWVVDAKRRKHHLATLYQRGLDFETAAQKSEWAYINMCRRITPDIDATSLNPPIENLDHLLKLQNETFRLYKPDGKVTQISFPDIRNSERCAIRHFEHPQYPTTEITGFVEFDDFIFFMVLFTPLVVQRKNERKLKDVLRMVIPINIKHRADGMKMTPKDDQSDIFGYFDRINVRR